MDRGDSSLTGETTRCGSDLRDRKSASRRIKAEEKKEAAKTTVCVRYENAGEVIGQDRCEQK